MGSITDGGGVGGGAGLTQEQSDVLAHLSINGDTSRLISDVAIQTTEHSLHFGDVFSASATNATIAFTHNASGAVSLPMVSRLGDHSTVDGQTFAAPTYKHFEAYTEKDLGSVAGVNTPIAYTRMATPVGNTASFGTTFQVAEAYTGDLHYVIKVAGVTVQNRTYAVDVAAGEIVTQFWREPTLSFGGQELEIILTKADDTNLMVYSDADNGTRPWVVSNSRDWSDREIDTPVADPLWNADALQDFKVVIPPGGLPEGSSCVFAEFGTYTGSYGYLNDALILDIDYLGPVSTGAGVISTTPTGLLLYVVIMTKAKFDSFTIGQTYTFAENGPHDATMINMAIQGNPTERQTVVARRAIRANLTVADESKWDRYFTTNGTGGPSSSRDTDWASPIRGTGSSTTTQAEFVCALIGIASSTAGFDGGLECGTYRKLRSSFHHKDSPEFMSLMGI